MRIKTPEVFHIRDASVQSLKDSARSSIESSQSSTRLYKFWEENWKGNCKIT